MGTTVASLLVLLDETPATVDVVSSGESTRSVREVRVLFSLSPPRSAPDILWVLPPLDRLTPPRLDSLLLELRGQGAAGLVVTLGRVDESSRLLAARLGLLLVGIAADHLGEVVRTWQGHIVASRLTDFRRVENLKSALLDAWLAAPTVEAYLDRAGEIMDGRVVFAERVVDEPLVGDRRRHRIEVPWGKGLGTTLAVDLSPDWSDEAVSELLRHLSSLVAMRIEHEVAAIESDIRLRGELLLELLVSDSPGGSVIRAAERFGLDLGKKHTVVLWDIDGFTAVSRRPDMHEARILRLKRDIVDGLEQGARCRFTKVWVLPHSDEFVLIAEGEDRKPEPSAVRSLVRDLQANLQELLTSYGVSGISAGIGFAYAGSGGLRKSFEEAREALAVGTGQFGPASTTHFHDLGIHRFLYGWVSSPRSRDLAQDFLGALIDDNSHSKADLLRTLRVYLEARGKSAAAQELGIHRNTLNYRLSRIEELLHVDLSDPVVQMVMQLLVRALPDPVTMPPSK